MYTLTTRVKGDTCVWAYTRAMGDTERLGIKEVRAAMGPRVDAAYYLGAKTIITKNLQDRAALVPLSVLERAALADRYEAKYGPLTDDDE